MTDIRNIWQQQPVEGKEMITLSDLCAHADKFHAKVKWRNAALYAYAFVNIAITAWLIATGRLRPYWAPMLLMVVAHLFVAGQVWWRIRARDLPGDLGAKTALEFLRQDLTRQRDALAGAWAWYIAPFLPALIWEFWIRAHTPPLIPGFRFMVLSGFLFWLAVWLAFSRGAARLDVQIERLNGVKAE